MLSHRTVTERAGRDSQAFLEQLILRRFVQGVVGFLYPSRPAASTTTVATPDRHACANRGGATLMDLFCDIGFRRHRKIEGHPLVVAIGGALVVVSDARTGCALGSPRDSSEGVEPPLTFRAQACTREIVRGGPTSGTYRSTSVGVRRPLRNRQAATILESDWQEIVGARRARSNDPA